MYDMYLSDFGERVRDIMKKCKHPCLTSSLVDVFKPYRLTLWLSMFSQGCIFRSIIALSFIPRKDLFRS